MDESNFKTILLVGGGTGGHSIPLLLIYNYLKAKKTEIKIIGSDSELDRNIFQGVTDFIPFRSGKFHRHERHKNLGELVKFVGGLRRSKKILNEVKPTVIFSKGGYISLPFVYWAKRMKIPYYIHESDIEMGKTNLFAAPNAEKVFVGFPVNNYSSLDQSKLEFVGQIVRPESNRNKKYELFGLAKDRPVLFVTGGSQGASELNKYVLNSLPELLQTFSAIHQTGSNDLAEIKKIRQNLPDDLRKNYFIRDFMPRTAECDWMSESYNIADLILARAGATTIGEIASFQKPAVLVPYKYAADNHQEKNAQALAQGGAAAIFSGQGDQSLADFLLSLWQDKAKIKSLSSNIANFFPADPIEKIGRELLKGIE